MTPPLALVTGATGFVGSHLVDELLASGYRVRAAVRATSDLRWLQGKPVETVLADLVTDDLTPLVEEVELTFHLAGLTRGSPRELRLANVEGTNRLARALQARPGHRVVFCSSQAAAGPGRLGRPRRVEEPPEPRTAYGWSKLDGERILRDRSPALRTTSIRAVAVYGPRDEDTLPFFRMAQRGLVLQPGLRYREVQLVHARDLAVALRLAGETPGAEGKTYFVGDPTVWAWSDVARAMGRAVGRRVTVLPVPSPAVLAAGAALGTAAPGGAGRLDLRRARDLVQRAWTCDVEPAMRELGWSPRFGLEEGLRDAARWYLDRGWR